jgi:Fe-S oxidoreductase
MYTLKFDENLCATCQTVDCRVKCPFIEMNSETGHKEMMKIIRGEYSSVLRDCKTCYACEEYCPLGNHPFYMITERREEKGMLTASRAITNQWINMCEPQGKYKVGEVREKALSCCFIGELRRFARGKLFDDIRSSYLLGPEFFCEVVYLHFAKPSIIKNRLPRVIENIHRLGIKQLICMHDECYGSFTSLAPAYGMEVPFEPIHYFEYLLEKLRDLKGEIRPLKIRAAYQRPCSSRLSPGKYHLVGKIFDLIGVEMVKREYQGENALCCGEVLRMVAGYEVADQVQKNNIEDMVLSQAEYCVFNCPYCQMALSEKVFKKGIKPIHIIDLCKMAIGEK